jgi:hypothetical protein
LDDFDVTNQVNTTEPAAVNSAINRIFVKLYPKASTRVVTRSFRDLVRLHLGEYPGYRASDTSYHNLQHTLDVTLAMARLRTARTLTRPRRCPRSQTVQLRRRHGVISRYRLPAPHQ